MRIDRTFAKRLGYTLISLTLALAASSPVAMAPQVAHAAGPYVVDTTLDAPDSTPGDGVCNDGAGHCTVRAAIQEAFSDIGPTNITFSSTLAGSTIVLSNTLTTGTIVWDGSDITLNGGTNNITISGALLSAGKSIFKIDGDQNVLANLTVEQAPQDGVQVGDFSGGGFGNHNTLTNVTLIDNGAAGVYVLGGSSGGGQYNTIDNSHIGSANNTACGAGNGTGVFIDQGATGTNLTSSFISCNMGRGVEVMNAANVSMAGDAIGIYYNALLGNGGEGIYASGTTGLFIGGGWISDNGADGILLANSTQAQIQANTIGTNAGASAANPNGGNGIELGAGSNLNTIGGLTPSLRNIISGNGLSGILLDGAGTHDNTIEGNYIGTNLTGAAAIANGLSGVRLQNFANSNTIGGHGSTNVRNLISGNTLDGILLQSGAASNYIDGNFIGLAANGLNALPNGLAGVDASNAPLNGIGGSYPSTQQFISGNHWQGVYAGHADGTYIGPSNRIGVAADDATPRGNGQQGVLMNESINATIVPFAVVYNGGSGVGLTGVDSQNDKIAPTWVADNGGLPIDLGEDGATANDTGDGDGGPNTLLNYPVITSYAGSVITGTACANCTIFIYSVRGNPAAPGGGGFQIQTAAANGAGQWSASLIGGLHHLDVSLVACQSPCSLASNTSEMSPRPILFLPMFRR